MTGYGSVREPTVKWHLGQGSGSPVAAALSLWGQGLLSLPLEAACSVRGFSKWTHPQDILLCCKYSKFWVWHSKFISFSCLFLFVRMVSAQITTNTHLKHPVFHFIKNKTELKPNYFGAIIFDRNTVLCKKKLNIKCRLTWSDFKNCAKRIF